MASSSITKCSRFLLRNSAYNFNILTSNNDSTHTKSYINNCRNVLSNHQNTCVRWSLHRMYSSAGSSGMKTPEGAGPTAASKIVQEILAAKVKDDSKGGADQKKKDPEAEENEKKKEEENARRALKFSFITFGVLFGGISGTLLFRWGAPPEDDEGNVLKDELSELPIVEQYLRRTYREMRVMNRMIQEPSREQLLPDELKDPYIQPPYTLVLEMKDVLVHPEWTYQTGWRFKKRPGVELLLQQCAPPLFEIVIYTNEQGFTAFPVLDKLDPHGFIWYRLFKDSTRYVDGRHVKDLNCLNRNLKKVVMVDWDGEAVSCPRNQLRLKRWDGNMDDTGLLQLAQMLRTIAESEVDDVRDVLDYYRNHADPLAAFTQNQQEAFAHEQQLQQQQKHGPGVAAADGTGAPKSTATWTPSFVKRWQK